MTSPHPIITIDLEDWFHLLECDAIPSVAGWSGLESRIEANTVRLLDLLAEQDIKSTFFSLGWVAERYPSLLRRIVDAGHDMGCHSHLHTLVHQQTPKAFREETQQAIDRIQDAISTRVTCYRAPGFSITGASIWAFQELAGLGITMDSSVFPGRHSHGGTDTLFAGSPFLIETGGCTLKEFPISLTRVGPIQVAYAGGGYFRLLPGFLIHRWIRKNPYTMTYFHPRDFDPGQPRLQGLSLGRSIKSYVGMDGAFRKLQAMLSTFGGCSLTEADREVSWASVPCVRL